jgi:hypothetical protein
MSKVTSIVSIQDLLIRWRCLGYRRLSTGIELLGSVPGEEQDTWIHAVFPGLTAQELRAMEDQLRQPIPAGPPCVLSGLRRHVAVWLLVYFLRFAAHRS